MLLYCTSKNRNKINLKNGLKLLSTIHQKEGQRTVEKSEHDARQLLGQSQDILLYQDRART